jgi:hypothetical protein
MWAELCGVVLQLPSLFGENGLSLGGKQGVY